ncbi:MAG TPA: flagellar basal body rod protein FlgB [Oscillospiraceae bacterium]|nr:flagellar basal body rod protein FlgB [Oscillospiraceae bacterium]
MALFNTQSFNITKQGLDALWLKQQVISQNIANQNTPDYKQKHVEFSGVLREKLDANGDRIGKKRLEIQTTVIEEDFTNGQPDGNNVDADQQQLELARAQLQYEALINKINGEFSNLRTAMRTSG